ncbi:hypothetical protein K788_0003306 [Paraburkholderia caribensis MBA4]|uniref:Uncharacterized protein n=1 Tax=Paraburkholderia caribensis MBA4 TaxID=1323664 RepID=A0A0P0RCK8_9BURK|nr:hypothetical protein K788_0003306 [Paraburkholderia caribensis MBA4]
MQHRGTRRMHARNADARLRASSIEARCRRAPMFWPGSTLISFC